MVCVDPRLLVPNEANKHAMGAWSIIWSGRAIDGPSVLALI